MSFLGVQACRSAAEIRGSVILTGHVRRFGRFLNELGALMNNAIHCRAAQISVIGEIISVSCLNQARSQQNFAASLPRKGQLLAETDGRQSKTQKRTKAIGCQNGRYKFMTLDRNRVSIY